MKTWITRPELKLKIDTTPEEWRERETRKWTQFSRVNYVKLQRCAFFHSYFRGAYLKCSCKYLSFTITIVSFCAVCMCAVSHTPSPVYPYWTGIDPRQCFHMWPVVCWSKQLLLFFLHPTKIKTQKTNFNTPSKVLKTEPDETALLNVTATSSLSSLSCAHQSMTRNTLATATITSCSAESNSLGDNGKFAAINGLTDVVAACLPSIDETTPLFGEIFDELILHDGYCALLAEEMDNSPSSDKMIDSLMNYRDDNEEDKVNISPNILSPDQLSKVTANESIDVGVWREGWAGIMRTKAN